MASIRELKKELNQELSAVIEECYAYQLSADSKGYEKAEKVIDEAIKSFDDFIAKIHLKDVKSQKANLKSVREDLKKRTSELFQKIEKLKA